MHRIAIHVFAGTRAVGIGALVGTIAALFLYYTASPGDRSRTPPSKAANEAQSSVDLAHIVEESQRLAGEIESDQILGPIARAMRTADPERYANLHAQIRNDLASGMDRQSVLQHAARTLQMPPADMRTWLATAPHDALARVRLDEIRMYEEAQRYAPSLCSLSGTARRDSMPAVPVSVMRLQARLYASRLEAYTAGRANPVQRPSMRLSQADDAMLVAQMRANGATSTDIAVLTDLAAQQSADIPAQCAALILYLNAINDLPEEESDRITAWRMGPKAQ